MTENEVDILNRRITETETRLLSRLLLSAEQILSPENYSLVVEKFKDNEALDLLYIEREVASNAKKEADLFRKIVESAKLYRDNKRRFDVAKADVSLLEEKNDVSQTHQDMITSREKLFSLIDSYRMQENFKKQIS
jgi:hypothetical protein